MKIKNLIKSGCASLLLVFVSTMVTQGQSIIAQWTFETSQPAGAQAAGVWFTNVLAEIGSGTASGLHANACNYTTPAGDGSSHSFSSTNWSVGDFYQFAVSTSGYDDITVSWDQISSSTGPGKFLFQYSADGVNFTNFGSAYTVLANATPNTWSAGTSNSASFFSQNLSSISALNNASAVWFRLADDSTASANNGTVAVAGTDRVDNFTVTGEVPSVPPVQILSPFLTNGTFNFSFQTLLNTNYTVLANGNLNTTNWLAVTNVTGDGNAAIISVPLTTSNQFYQVSEQL